MTTTKTAWTHKVVKKSRGMDGEWFTCGRGRTFGSFAEAVRYAARFHAEQHAVLGVSDSHRYVIVPRRRGGETCEFRSLWTPEQVSSRVRDLVGATA